MVLLSLSLSLDSSSSTLVPTVSNDDELAPLAAGSNANDITFCSESYVATASDSLPLDNRDREETGETLEAAESKLLIFILFIVTAN